MDSDLIKLYSTRILALAAEIPHLGRLDLPMGTYRARSPQCGSAITVDVAISGDHVVEFAQDVKACALGQAAASILGSKVIGLTLGELRATQAALRDMLETGERSGELDPDYEVLRAAIPFKNRHASIMLSLDATVAAFEDAQMKVA